MRRRLIIALAIYLLAVGGFGANWFVGRANIGRNIATVARITKADNELHASKASKDYEGVPTHLYIPSLGLNLEVIKGSYDSLLATWTLTPNKAQFATATRELNTKGGLSLIYGHDVPKVFKATANMKLGDLVEVQTENGFVFTYKYVSSEVISPDDTGFLSYKGKPRLSLLTCTGLWYQYRHLMNFNLVGVRHLNA